MYIEQDIKLGFKDVMIRPKRSTLQSRSEVSLDRKFQVFAWRQRLGRHSGYGCQYGYGGHV